MSLQPMKSGKLKSVGDLGGKFGDVHATQFENHHKVLVQHGYKHVGVSKLEPGSSVYRHASGNTAINTPGRGTTIHHADGTKLNTLSTSTDLHGYLTDKHGGAKHSDEGDVARLASAAKASPGFGPMDSKHHQVLEKHGYKYAGKTVDIQGAGEHGHFYRHPNGNTAFYHPKTKTTHTTHQGRGLNYVAHTDALSMDKHLSKLHGKKGK